MTPSTALVPTVNAEIVQRRESDDWMPVFSIQAAEVRRDAIVDFVKRIMVPNTDFGVIPGTKSKPVLLKPGAERLCSFFGLSPEFLCESERMDWDGQEHHGEPFFYFKYQCRLSRNGKIIGSGEGSCSSWESKYRYRQGERKCPKCEGAFIIKGKQEYGGGWLCFAKKGGCGEKFPEGDKAIEGQDVGRVPNPDVADQVNTIQKMAQKRALIAAVLIGVNASEFFTQEFEDNQPQAGWSDSGSQSQADEVAQKKLAAAGIKDDRVAISETLREIKRVLSEYSDSKQVKGELLQLAFGTHTWAKVEEMDLETIGSGLRKIAQEIKARSEKAEHLTEEQLFRSLDKFKRLAAFGEMKERIGEMAYYRILKAHGAEKSNQFQSVDAEWAAYLEMSKAAPQDAFDKHMAEPVKLVPSHVKKLTEQAARMDSKEFWHIIAFSGYEKVEDVPADEADEILAALRQAAEPVGSF